SMRHRSSARRSSQMSGCGGVPGMPSAGRARRSGLPWEVPPPPCSAGYSFATRRGVPLRRTRFGPLPPISLGVSMGCSDRDDTYYAVLLCKHGCAEPTASGTPLLRLRLLLPPAHYTASVERQDVIRDVGLGPESLTREGWTCTVRTRRDWECEDEPDPRRVTERFRMVNGDLIHLTVGLEPESDMVFVPY